MVSSMPITTRCANGLMEIRMAGRVSAADLKAHMREVATIESKVAVTPNRIMDLRDGTAGDVKFENLHGLAEARRIAVLKNPIKTAILATTPVQIGLARTFQTINDNPQITIQIFREESEARAWLAEGDGEHRTP